MKFLAFMVMLMGLYELYKLTNLSYYHDLTKKVKDFNEAMAKDPDYFKKNIAEVGEVIMWAVVHILTGFFELAILIPAVIFFPAPLRWMILGTILLPFINKQIEKYSEKFYWRWLYVDHVICATIYIGGVSYYI